MFDVPIYEYQCVKCGERFEKLLRSMNSSETIECPKCGSKKTERAMSSFAVGGEAPARSSAKPAHSCCGGCCGGHGGGGSCPIE